MINKRLNGIPDNEFSNDIEYQKSMDEAWHGWQQEKWDKQRQECEENLKSGKGYKTLKIIHEDGRIEERGE